MSITMSTTPIDPLTWKQADADVHVATRDGEFAGFVEFNGTAYVLRDERGTELGAFPGLDDARRALQCAQPAGRSRLLDLLRSGQRSSRRRLRRARV